MHCPALVVPFMGLQSQRRATPAQLTPQYVRHDYYGLCVSFDAIVGASTASGVFGQHHDVHDILTSLGM